MRVIVGGRRGSGGAKSFSPRIYSQVPEWALRKLSKREQCRLAGRPCSVAPFSGVCFHDPFATMVGAPVPNLNVLGRIPMLSAVVAAVMALSSVVAPHSWNN